MSRAVQVPGGLKRESGENPERTRRCNPDPGESGIKALTIRGHFPEEGREGR
jgi:hypothetical protein